MEPEAVQEAAQTAAALAFVEVTFFALVFIAGFIGGVFRTIRDAGSGTLSESFAVGVCSGTLGFGFVGWLLGPGHVPDFVDWYYVALSALIGLGGKEIEKLIRHIIVKAFGLVGITDGKEDGKQSD